MGSGGKRRGRRAAGDNKAEARGPKLQETWERFPPYQPRECTCPNNCKTEQLQTENHFWRIKTGIEMESNFIFIHLLMLCVNSPYIDTRSIHLESVPFRFMFDSQKVILCFNCSEIFLTSTCFSILEAVGFPKIRGGHYVIPSHPVDWKKILNPDISDLSTISRISYTG